MTQQQLSESLKTLSAGQYARLPYDVFPDFFPPSIEDDPARKAAYDLARASGCVIQNRPNDGAVWFLRAD